LLAFPFPALTFGVPAARAWRGGVKSWGRKFVAAAIILAPVLILGSIGFLRLGNWLVVDDPLQKADAIFVLGGSRYERPLEAVDLYQAGWAPRVLLMKQIADAGERALSARGIPYRREVDEQIEVMVRLGVPSSAILVLNEADNTAEEADALYQAATTNRWSRVIIVTSKQHTRRARLVMRRRLAGTGVEVRMRYSRYDASDTDRWWRNRSTLRFTLFETQRLFGYWIGVGD
jgi:uncharacterized SAM-binding protein YcdF (DUF218 family)